MQTCAQTLLIAAAQCGSLKVLQELLKRNPLDVNETDQVILSF